MKSLVALSFVIAALGMTACGPEVAQQPLPPKQESWVKAMEASYPSWKRPKTVPAYTPVPVNELSGTYEPQAGSTFETEVSVEPIVVEPAETVIAPVIIEQPAVVVEPTPVALQPITPPPVTPAVKPLLIVKPELLKDGKYQVRPNDSFWIIASRLYGNGNLYKKIQEANPEAAAKKVLRVGTWLVIPGEAKTTTSATPIIAPEVNSTVAPVATSDSAKIAPVAGQDSAIAPSPKTVAPVTDTPATL